MSLSRYVSGNEKEYGRIGWFFTCLLYAKVIRKGKRRGQTD